MTTQFPSSSKSIFVVCVCVFFKEENKSILLYGVNIEWSGFMKFGDQSKACN